MNNKIALADHWLETLGYSRTRMPHSENCLFQAVSYQLFSSHLFHETVRDFCLSYVTKNNEEFMNMFGNLNCWESYLSKLKNHTNTCKLVELYMISFTYQKCIIVFDGLSHTVEKIGDSIYTDELRLCYMGCHHYDAVNKFKTIREDGEMDSALNVNPSPVNAMNNECADEGTSKEKHTQLDLLDTARAPEPICIFRRNAGQKGKTSFSDNKRDLEEELLGTSCTIESENGEVLNGFISKVLDEEACLVHIPSRQENRKISIRHLQLLNDVNSLPPSNRYRKEKKKRIKRRRHTPSPVQNNNTSSYNRNTGPSISNTFGDNRRMPPTETVINDNTATPANTGLDYTFPMSTPNFYPFRQPEVNRNNPTQQMPWYNLDHPRVVNETMPSESQGFSNPESAAPTQLTPSSPPQLEMDPSVALQYSLIVDATILFM